eukprot:Seg275.11 transcript_id=Seg275.11/GoldUCD/mRNA.D3Y31 product="Potassium channel subfamily K member 5" protein_id=Seg275.11/GoldUCD/D3Y31
MACFSCSQQDRHECRNACLGLVKRGLFILLIQIIGWVMFTYVEGDFSLKDCFTNPTLLGKQDAEMIKYKQLFYDLQNKTNQTLNTSQKKFIYFKFKKYFNGHLTPSPTNGDADWGIKKCMTWYRFSVVTMTTIGYGTITPKTDTGKMLVIVYALITIPMMLSLLGLFGSLISGYAEGLMKCIHKIVKGDRPLRYKYIKKTFYFFIFMVLYTYIPIPGFIYDVTILDSYLNAFYFFFVTFTTVGYGDIVAPAEDASFYATNLLFGLAAVSAVIDSILDLKNKLKFGCKRTNSCCCFHYIEDDEEQNEEEVEEDRTNVQLRDLEKAGYSNNGYNEDVSGESLKQRNRSVADQEREKEDTHL